MRQSNLPHFLWRRGIWKCCHPDQAQRVEGSSHCSFVGIHHYFGAYRPQAFLKVLKSAADFSAALFAQNRLQSPYFYGMIDENRYRSTE